MINAQKYNDNEIPSFELVDCPSCNKVRLLKQINKDGSINAVNQQTVEVRGNHRYLEVCDYCIIKYRKEDERFVKENLKKLSQAFTDNIQRSDSESDHKDFSLN